MPFVPPLIDVLSSMLTPAAPPGEQPVIQADAIDPTTGEFISLERGYDPTDAAFLLAMTVVRGSGSAVEDLGQKFGDHKHVDEQLEPFMREETRLAAKHLTDAGDIELGTVQVTANGTAVDLYVEWKNLARDKANKLPLPLNLLVGGA